MLSSAFVRASSLATITARFTTYGLSRRRVKSSVDLSRKLAPKNLTAESLRSTSAARTKLWVSWTCSEAPSCGITLRVMLHLRPLGNLDPM
jgi:hypothetical protein